MAQEKSLRDLYYNIGKAGRDKAPDTLKTLLEQPGLRAALLQPMSATVAENTLTYMISDGWFDGFYSSDTPRKAFTQVVLDAIEKATADPAERMAVLTSANDFGQTPFHKCIRYGGDLETFDMLATRLRSWGGDDAANTFLKGFIDSRLGGIDHDMSNALQDVRNIRPNGSPEAVKLNTLCNDSYKPASYDGLKAAVDWARPYILEWLDKHADDPKKSDYQRGKEAKMRAFAQDPDCVKVDGTPITQAFPGPLFEYLLRLEQHFGPAAPQAQADRIFARLSQPNAEGDTAMHRRWQHSTLMGPPPGPGCVQDRLGALIASFDRMLGTEAAVDLTKKLLLQENSKGALPLDDYEYNDMPRRNYYIEAFLRDLRGELGDRDKFHTYLKEVVAAVLPADFSIKVDKYEPVEKNPETGEPKPRRGARLDF